MRHPAGRRTTPSGFGRVAAAAALLAAIVAFFPAADTASAQSRPDSFAGLAQQLSPAVVNISTAQTVERSPGARRIPEGTPLEDFFREFFDQQGPGGPRRVESLGSGFVIDADGFVVTNNHVIEGADEIEVNFVDGSSLKAELIGTDPKTDLALLKVAPPEPLPFVPFGDSDASRVGDWVLAIGNPFGLGGSVSAGIISAFGRNINAGPYDDFIQTDAAINRGNSGGPLFNMAGEVIGVNTAIISPSGGSIGIGFSVPARLAEPIVEQLREFGKPRRGWLGVRIRDVDEERAAEIGLDDARGAQITGVTEGGPADEGGVAVDDVILSFNGAEIGETRDLQRIVAETQVGDIVEVVVWRDGAEETLSVEVALLAEDAQPSARATPQQEGESAPDAAPSKLTVLGLTLEAVSDDLRDRYGLAASLDGVVIVEVDPASAGAEQGVRVGDVIVEVAQTLVTTPQEVSDRVEEALTADRRTVLMMLDRNGEMVFVGLPLPR